MAVDAELLALAVRVRALEERVAELENRPVPAWLHTARRDQNNLISEIISEPLIDDEAIAADRDLT